MGKTRNMRKDFYIFRHGETNHNKENRWQGSGTETLLNETGIAQAAKLVELLSGKGLEIIYSSPMKRALHTAAIVAEALQLDIILLPDLREAGLGIAEGQLDKDVAQRFPELYKQWNDLSVESMEAGFCGGESKSEIQERMLSVLSNLLESDYRVMGISSHGAAIRLLLLHFGLPYHEIPNTACFHLFYDNGKWEAEQLLAE